MKNIFKIKKYRTKYIYQLSLMIIFTLLVQWQKTISLTI